MDNLPKTRSFAVTGASLDLIKAYHEEVEALSIKRQALRDEYTSKMQEVAEHTQAQLRELWIRIAATVGLDPEQTWGNPAFQIESRYLEHGFGAVIYQPVEPNPMEAALGVEPEGVSDDPDKVPEGSTIN